MCLVRCIIVVYAFSLGAVGCASSDVGAPAVAQDIEEASDVMPDVRQDIAVDTTIEDAAVSPDESTTAEDTQPTLDTRVDLDELDSADVSDTTPAVNHPPVLAPVSSATLVEGETVTFTLDATDPDGDTITLSVFGLPQGANFDPATGAFSWSPGFDTVKTVSSSVVVSVDFRAKDSGSPTETDFVSVVYTVVNDEDHDGVSDWVDDCVSDPVNDVDGDTLCADVDNCPTVLNIDQHDLDGDGDGDACDTDADGDGVLNSVDGCPAVPNPTQLDYDLDGLADACEAIIRVPDSISRRATPQGFPGGSLGRNSVLSYAGGNAAITFATADSFGVCTASLGVCPPTTALVLEKGDYAASLQQPYAVGDSVAHADRAGGAWVQLESATPRHVIAGIVSTPYPEGAWLEQSPDAAVLVTHDDGALDRWVGAAHNTLVPPSANLVLSPSSDGVYVLTGDDGAQALYHYGFDGQFSPLIASTDTIDLVDAPFKKDGHVWVCDDDGVSSIWQEFDGATPVVGAVAAFPTTSSICGQAFLSVRGVTNDVVEADVDGARWFRDCDETGLCDVYRVDATSDEAQSVIEGVAGAFGVFSAGGNTYLVTGCSAVADAACRKVLWYDADHLVSVYNSVRGFESFPQVGASGVLAFAYRTAVPGTPSNPTQIVAVRVDQAESAEMPLPIVGLEFPYIDAAWLDGDGAFWVEVYHGGTTNRFWDVMVFDTAGAALTVVPSGGPKGARLFVDAAGNRLLTTLTITYTAGQAHVLTPVMTHTSSAFPLSVSGEMDVSGWLAAEEEPGRYAIRRWLGGTLGAPVRTNLSSVPKVLSDQKGAPLFVTSVVTVAGATEWTLSRPTSAGLTDLLTGLTKEPNWLSPPSDPEANWLISGLAPAGKQRIEGAWRYIAGQLQGPKVLTAGLVYDLESMIGVMVPGVDGPNTGLCTYEAKPRCWDVRMPIAAFLVAPADGGDGHYAALLTDDGVGVYLWRSMEQPTPSSCCVSGGPNACESAAVTACVCASDTHCCASSWDVTCAEEVTSLGCGSCQ